MSPKTLEEKMALVKELRATVAADVSHPDFLKDGYLFNWLEEKKFVVKKAARRIRETMKWRADNNIDNVFNEERIDDSWAPAWYQQAGFDPEGRPIYVGFALLDMVDEQKAAMDPQSIPSAEALFDMAKEYEKKVNMDSVMRHMYYYMEHALQLLRDMDLFSQKSQLTGEPLHSIVAIGDCKGADLVEAQIPLTDFAKYLVFVFPYAVDLYKICIRHYPGLIHDVYAVNAPKKMTRLAINMARPVVRSGLLDRLYVYGRKSAKWMPILHEKFGPNQLIEHFGGTLPLGENYFKNAGKYMPDPEELFNKLVEEFTTTNEEIPVQ